MRPHASGPPRHRGDRGAIRPQAGCSPQHVVGRLREAPRRERLGLDRRQVIRGEVGPERVRVGLSLHRIGADRRVVHVWALTVLVCRPSSSAPSGGDRRLDDVAVLEVLPVAGLSVEEGLPLGGRREHRPDDPTTRGGAVRAVPPGVPVRTRSPCRGAGISPVERLQRAVDHVGHRAVLAQLPVDREPQAQVSEAVEVARSRTSRTGPTGVNVG